MDDFGKLIEDCEVYHKAMNRMKVLGIRDEQKVIVYLQREIDHYRDKIRNMEEIARSNEGVKKDIHAADLFGYMPKDMASRISSLHMDSDGSVSVVFGTNEDHRAVAIKGSLESLKKCMRSFKNEKYSLKRNKKAYLCNGKVKGCKKTYCYLNGGECRHTFNRRYRRNKFLNIFDDFGMEIE